MEPKVSVVIPARNAAKFLPTSIGSVQRQSFADWECIVIDDGSTDGTRELVTSLASEDPRIRYRYKEHDAQKSLSTTRNFGIDLAKGEWIQLLDADDWLHPDKISVQIQRSESAPTPSASVMYCDYEVVWEDSDGGVERRSDVIVGELNTEEMLSRIMSWRNETNMPLHVNTVLIHRDVLQRRRFDESLRGFEEIELFVALLLLGVDFVYTPIVGMWYRRHDSNVTHDSRRFVFSYLEFLRAIHGMRPDLVGLSPKVGDLFESALIRRDGEILQEIIGVARETRVPVHLNALGIKASNPALLSLLWALRPFIPYGRLSRMAEKRSRERVDTNG